MPERCERRNGNCSKLNASENRWYHLQLVGSFVKVCCNWRVTRRAAGTRIGWATAPSNLLKACPQLRSLVSQEQDPPAHTRAQVDGHGTVEMFAQTIQDRPKSSMGRTL